MSNAFSILGVSSSAVSVQSWREDDLSGKSVRTHTIPFATLFDAATQEDDALRAHYAAMYRAAVARLSFESGRRADACPGHRAQTTATRPFTGAVSRAPNDAAHGGVCEHQTCACGASRHVNVDGSHVEEGPWSGPDAEDLGVPWLPAPREPVAVDYLLPSGGTPLGQGRHYDSLDAALADAHGRVFSADLMAYVWAGGRRYTLAKKRDGEGSFVHTYVTVADRATTLRGARESEQRATERGRRYTGQP